MTRRENFFTLSGVAVGLVLGGGLFAVAGPRRDHPAADPEVPRVATELSVAKDAGDPAMAANANLVGSLYECSHRLASVTDDDDRLEQLLTAERDANADAGASAQAARRVARRNLSQKDWADLARTGTIKYLLPCAAFNPPPEIVDQLGLAPGDVPMIRQAFAAARDAAWAQIRPLCATALGNADAVDKLGLEACPQLILDTQMGANAHDTQGAMRAVAAVRAGLVDPSASAVSDPARTTFLVMTQIAKDTESRLAAQFRPEDARAIVYGRNSCSRMVEFTGPGPEVIAK